MDISIFSSDEDPEVAEATSSASKSTFTYIIWVTTAPVSADTDSVISDFFPKMPMNENPFLYFKSKIYFEPMSTKNYFALSVS